MKTLELLDKYQKVIAGRLNCKPENIKFYREGKLVGKLGWYKNEQEARDYAEENHIPFNMDDHVFVENNWDLGKFEVKEYIGLKDITISTFKLYQLPHCCAYAVSCNAKVFEKYRNNRIGTILNDFRQDLCRLLGYSALLCTDIEKNIYQRQLLKTNNWKDIHNLVNKRTQNRVYLSVINL